MPVAKVWLLTLPIFDDHQFSSFEQGYFGTGGVSPVGPGDQNKVGDTFIFMSALHASASTLAPWLEQQISCLLTD